MHRLIDEGQGDSAEAEALADQMDAPWHAMTPQEQSRMRGLASDLHALREGGPKRVEMTPEQLAAWRNAFREANNRSESGDIDAALDFLRRPVPSELPRQFIPFLQARYWERLGDLETALLFMQESDRQDPNQALSVLLLLQQLGRLEEVPQYADRVIVNPSSPPLELYLAAVALLDPRRQLPDAQATPILQKAVTVLRRALSEYLGLAPEEKAESPDADAFIAQALGFGLEQLGELSSAVTVYTDAIGRHPRNGDLLVARGLALYEKDPSRAFADFVSAVRVGVTAIWPYLLLAQNALQCGSSAEALRLALLAERQPGSASARAQVYETIGMALAELGRPQERVLENFDKAIALDPKNDRIRENRDMAAALPAQSRSGRAGRLRLRPAPPFKAEGFRRDWGDQINNYTELLNEQRRNRMSSRLVEV
jgi:tetratricopeptide (TPR) repeat protein